MGPFEEIVNEVLSKAKGGPYIGPKGGKWADPEHKIPWSDAVAKRSKKLSEQHPVAHAAVMVAHRGRTPTPSSARKAAKLGLMDQGKLTEQGKLHAAHHAMLETRATRKAARAKKQ
jgi:hypothetical protein